MAELSYVFEGRVRRSFRRSMRELWTFRETAFALAERSVRVQYKQAILGIAWAVIQPVTYIVIFTLALSGRVHTAGATGYAAFALSVQIPWSFLQAAISTGAASTVGNSGTMRKIYFPREVLVIGAALSSAVNLAIGTVLFFALAPLVHAHLSPWWLLLPILELILAAIAVGIGLALAAFSVYYRDFGYVIPFALQAWWIVSTAVPLSALGHQHVIVLLNPAAGILNTFQRVVAEGLAPNPALLLLSVIQATTLTAVGYLVFKRLEPNFSDVA